MARATASGDWKQDNPAAMGDTTHAKMVYAIQSPFTGELHYPPDGRHWRNEKRRMKKWLEAWGAEYVEKDISDGKAKALLIAKAPAPGQKGFSTTNQALVEARESAEKRLNDGNWPALYFGHTGKTKPMMKVYLSEVKAGSVPTTFWVEEGDDPVELDAVSWSSSESGRSREGAEELDAMMGTSHNFKTVVVRGRSGPSWARMSATGPAAAATMAWNRTIAG